MLAGEFARKLRELNPELKVFCGDNDSRPAGLYQIVAGEYDQICSVDKQWVGEHAEVTDGGFIKRSGWRRVLRLLIHLGLVDRRHAERVFNTHLPYAVRPVEIPTKRQQSVEELAEKYSLLRGK